MIWIFNLERASAGVCDNYSDVYQYIRGLGDQKKLETGQISTHTIEMLPLGGEADQKQWCIDFCKIHNYAIIETPSQAVNCEHSPSNSQSYTQEHFKQAS